MSSMLEHLLDAQRLSDCIDNDLAMGIVSAPPVELDEAFFERADLAYAQAKQSGELDRRRLHRAHELQQQRLFQGGRIHG